jgi:hypothetical protein
MSRASSYFDWEKQFKSSNKSTNKSNLMDLNHIIPLNSIGISYEEFKKYLNKWKEKNLS